jgi:thioredoxin-dependent peroxiredoxin
MVRGVRLVALLAVGGASGCIPPGARPPPAVPAAEADGSLLAEGSAVPEVTALGSDGKPVSLGSFRGKFLVVYFYPLDFAAGASAEAEEFRADYASYRKLGASIVGISTDDPRTHQEFATKYKLPYPLLSDRGGEVARAFGVPLTGGATRHATFLVDRRAVVRKVWPKVRPWGHSAEVLTALRALGK